MLFKMIVSVRILIDNYSKTKLLNEKYTINNFCVANIEFFKNVSVLCVINAKLYKNHSFRKKKIILHMKGSKLMYSFYIPLRIEEFLNA